MVAQWSEWWGQEEMYSTRWVPDIDSLIPMSGARTVLCMPSFLRYLGL